MWQTVAARMGTVALLALQAVVVQAKPATPHGVQVPVEQQKSLRLSDLRQDRPEPPRPVPKSKTWNVVWIIMESTGTRYLSDTAPKVPMPFFDKLASEGWLLARHHSTTNSSARAIFSQLSGLYPMPTLPMWVDRGDVAVPSLPALLGPGWNTFLYTPGRLNYYFPKGFLQAGGLDCKGYTELPLGPKDTIDPLARREEAVVDAFVKRVHSAHEPFLGVYYSYVAHWPYSDHGPQYRHYSTSTPQGRYHNNLVTLDAQIQRIFEQVKADGRLDRTIFVLAGDHGEAFGQHQGNWSHPKFSYEENLQTPAVLWQPALFAPRVVSELTSHVDLLPTVLDALGVPYAWQQLQGESLLRGPIQRNYLFTYGKEGTATILAADGKKLQRAANGTCWVLDLAADPKENKKLPCKPYAALAQQLDAQVAHQKKHLAGYNAAQLLDLPYAGLRHPTLVQHGGTAVKTK